MRFIFERGGLRLHVDPGAPLHAQALETWREASALAKTCIDALLPDEAAAACQFLAETATHALTAGRDDRVIAGFQKVERQIRDADETRRRENMRNARAIFALCILLGIAAGLLWMIVEPSAPWNKLPDGLALSANYILLTIGWTGFTLVGFSISWLLLVTSVMCTQGREDAIKQAVSLRQREAHIVQYAATCLIIVIFMFFFGGFDVISDALSVQLTSAPWAILLGLGAGVAAPELVKRIRASVNRFFA